MEGCFDLDEFYCYWTDDKRPCCCSRANVVSNIISKVVGDHGSAVLVTAGGRAMHVALMAVMLARSRLRSGGTTGRARFLPTDDLILVPWFVTVDTTDSLGYESVFVRFQIVRVACSLLGHGPMLGLQHAPMSLPQQQRQHLGFAPDMVAAGSSMMAPNGFYHHHGADNGVMAQQLARGGGMMHYRQQHQDGMVLPGSGGYGVIMAPQAVFGGNNSLSGATAHGLPHMFLDRGGVEGGPVDSMMMQLGNSMRAMSLVGRTNHL